MRKKVLLLFGTKLNFMKRSKFYMFYAGLFVCSIINLSYQFSEGGFDSIMLSFISLCFAGLLWVNSKQPKPNWYDDVHTMD